MSHIHLPDGFIPVIWWAAGYILTILIIYLVLKKINLKESKGKIPLTAVISAVMLLVMSIPLGFLPLHLSLAVLCGILVGPGLGFIAVFVVNLILALMGHGGITVAGLNTLIIGSEVFIGSYLFQVIFRRIHIVPRAMVATALSLLVSMAMMIGIVGSTAGLWEVLSHEHHEHCHHYHEENMDTHSHNDGHIHGEEKHYHTEDHHHTDEHLCAGEHHDNVDEHHNMYEHHHEKDLQHEDAYYVETSTEPMTDISLLTFTSISALIVILILAILIESISTALIVRFFAKVKPDLIKAS